MHPSAKHSEISCGKRERACKERLFGTLIAPYPVQRRLLPRTDCQFPRLCRMKTPDKAQKRCIWMLSGANCGEIGRDQCDQEDKSRKLGGLELPCESLYEDSLLAFLLFFAAFLSLPSGWGQHISDSEADDYCILP